jgi:hypothetical protein
MQFSNLDTVEIPSDLKEILLDLNPMLLAINNTLTIVNTDNIGTDMFYSLFPSVLESNGLARKDSLIFPFSIECTSFKKKIKKIDLLVDNIKTLHKGGEKKQYSNGGTCINFLEKNLLKYKQNINFYNGNIFSTKRSFLKEENNEIDQFSFIISNVEKIEYKSKFNNSIHVELYFVDSYNIQQNKEKNQIFYSLEQLEQQIIL